MTKIQPNEYFRFCQKFFRGGYPHLRFGQAFVNTYMTADLPNQKLTELFYERERLFAQEYIENFLVNWEN